METVITLDIQITIFTILVNIENNFSLKNMYSLNLLLNYKQAKLEEKQSFFRRGLPLLLKVYRKKGFCNGSE